MATRFRLKRSTVGGVTPTTLDIDTAELAVNLADRKVFTSNGSAVFEVGSNLANLSVTGNATINAIVANGELGTSGQVLSSNGTGIYWATSSGDGTVTNIATGSGLTGGPITTTGTVSVLANNGITSNTTGLFVTQGTGAVVNSTGVHVNSSFIGTLTANNATNFNAQPASFYANATNLTSGTLVTARLPETANIATAINVGANVTLTTSTINVGNTTVNVSINSTSIVMSNTQVLSSVVQTLSTVAKSTIASFPSTSFSSGKLLIQVSDTITQELQISEIITAHNGSTTYSTEYGIVFTGASALASFEIELVSNTVLISAQRSTTNLTRYKTSLALFTV